MYAVLALTFAITQLIFSLFFVSATASVITLTAESAEPQLKPSSSSSYHSFAFRGKSSNFDTDAAEHEFELTQALNIQRQEHVQRECEMASLSKQSLPQKDADGNHILDSSNDYEPQIANIPDDQLRHLLIDEKHKFLYCYVPKVSFKGAIDNILHLNHKRVCWVY